MQELLVNVIVPASVCQFVKYRVILFLKRFFFFFYVDSLILQSCICSCSLFLFSWLKILCLFIFLCFFIHFVFVLITTNKKQFGRDGRREKPCQHRKSRGHRFPALASLGLSLLVLSGNLTLGCMWDPQLSLPVALILFL